MNFSELERKLMAAARNHPPSDRVPFRFEKRVMSRVQSRPALDRCALWAHALWRSAAACVAVVVLLGAVTFFLPHKTRPADGDLSQDFEKTMLAAADQEMDLSP
jgi:anti-sigma-K factor RskA